MSSNQNLISTFRAFLNQLHANLLALGVDEDTVENVCNEEMDEIDLYEWFCQNTTQEQDADPMTLALELVNKLTLAA